MDKDHTRMQIAVALIRLQEAFVNYKIFWGGGGGGANPPPPPLPPPPSPNAPLRVLLHLATNQQP